MARERLEKEFHRFYLPGGEKRIGGDREGYFNPPIIILSYYCNTTPNCLHYHHCSSYDSNNTVHPITDTKKERKSSRGIF